jgi:hypothetical protein
MIIIIGTIFFELLFLLLYRQSKLKYEKIKSTGRVYDITHTYNWNQFFKVIAICLPLLAFWVYRDLFM